MSATVLSVASRAVLDTCEQLGFDTAGLLADAGLTRASLEGPDARIDADAADRLWQHAYERTGDPHLALHAAASLPFGAYKVIDYLAAHAATLGEGLTQVASYFPLVDPRGELVIELGDPVRLRMQHPGGGPIPPPAQEYTFTALVTRMRALATFALTRVELTFEAPPDPREHERVLGCEVRFGCAAAQLVIAERDWRAPLSTHDPALHAILEEHARARMAEVVTRNENTGRVRSAIDSILRERREPTLAEVARRLGASERTLQRRLKDEQVSFASLTDELRAAHARSYLRDPHLSLAEVAFLLGFADQSTFTRAFRRWTGIAPGAYRAALHAS